MTEPVPTYPEPAAPTVFTIGHSTRSLAELVSMLRANGVTDLIDVRSYPSSRVHPQWNQLELEESLPPDVRYHWMSRPGVSGGLVSGVSPLVRGVRSERS